ncbi:TetR/AcrR family transcriptional regulator C-terminal domain-containing protein [Streptomyces albidoflavus]
MDVQHAALGIFEALDTHPWVGPQLTLTERRSLLLRVFEGIGRQVQALGVPESARFTAASALMSYILGVAGQNAADSRSVPPGTDRAAYLGAVADSWAELGPAHYPFTREVTGQLRVHDDEAEFLAGVDLIVAGIAGLR